MNFLKSKWKDFFNKELFTLQLLKPSVEDKLKLYRLEELLKRDYCYFPTVAICFLEKSKQKKNGKFIPQKIIREFNELQCSLLLPGAVTLKIMYRYVKSTLTLKYLFNDGSEIEFDIKLLSALTYERYKFTCSSDLKDTFHYIPSVQLKKSLPTLL